MSSSTCWPTPCKAQPCLSRLSVSQEAWPLRQMGQRDEYHRRSRDSKLRPSHARYADGRAMGQGSLGTLLELGPQGDVGRHHIAFLSGLHPLPTRSTRPPQSRTVHRSRHLLPLADELVGHQLSPLSPWRQHPHLLHVIILLI